MRLQRYREYEPTGLAWCMHAPRHWRLARGKTLFRKMERPARPADDVITCFRDGTVTLRKNRRLTGFTESIKEIGYQGILKGDLVIHAMDAFAGAIGVSDSDGKSTPVYAVCEPRPGVNAAYYALMLREMSRSGYLLSLAKGIRERSTDFRYGDFAKELVPLPPEVEQAAIVKFSLHIDRRVNRLIGAKRRLIDLLNEEKHSIIRRAVTRGLDAAVLVKSSGSDWIGHVPAHWQVRRVKQVAKILRGKFSHRPRNDPALYDGTYPFIQTGEVARAYKAIRTYRQTLNDQGFAVSKMFPAGTLVMTIAANIGDVAVLDFDACFPDSIVGFAPRSFMLRDFMYYALVAMKSELLKEAPVNTQGNLNVDRVGAREIAVPPFKEQQELVTYIEQTTEELERAVTTMKSEIALIREYRNRLVSDVVTGQLDVRHLDLPDEEDTTTDDLVQGDAGEIDEDAEEDPEGED
jgi:type I restriction enzyme S subunit